MPDTTKIQEDLAEDIMEVLGKYRSGNCITYATVIGVFEIIKSVLLDEIEEETHGKDINDNPLLEALARTRKEKIERSTNEHDRELS